MRYVTYDDAGNLTGCFLQDLAEDHEAQHIEVSEEVATNWPAYRADATRSAVVLASVLPVPPAVPEVVPMLNAELVLIGAGYWDDVQAFISARGPYALAFLRRAQTMRRDNALVNAWAQARGKTAELDGLFIAAGNLDPDTLHA